MSALRFGSFCSGIGAPEVAWAALGWQPQFFSEIEPFPCVVLASRFPDVPNLGDMTKITDEQIKRFAVDVVIAGTPCQSFSVAGLRAGMADPRGNLALVFLRLVDAIRPRWLVWENVPGVLSSGEGRDFGAFLGALGKLGYGWAYRVLDAQYFGLAQRRKRVFVVGCLGSWTRAVAVLFERASLSGHPAPSRESRSRIAASLTRGADSNGAGGYAGRRREDDFNLVNALDAHMGSAGPDDNAAQARHLVPSEVPNVCPAIKSRDYKGPSSDGDGDGAILVPMVAYPITAAYAKGAGVNDTRKSKGPSNLLVTHSLRADGFDASEDGTGRGTPIIPILEAGKRCGTRNDARDGIGIGEQGDPMFTLQSGAQHEVAQLSMCEVRETNDRATGPCEDREGAGGNAALPEMRPVAFQTRIARNGRGQPEEICPTLQGADAGATSDMRPAVASGMAVRRLTPRECLRLQGFHDNWLDVNFRGKPAADGPKYRAIGNSMAVPCIHWIGERIEEVQAQP